MPVLQFATATANLASQNAVLFLATHGPIFIASVSFEVSRFRPSGLGRLDNIQAGLGGQPRMGWRKLTIPEGDLARCSESESQRL